jgi:hypothetical protein
MSEEAPPAGVAKSAFEEITGSAAAALQKGKKDAEEVVAKNLPGIKRSLAKGTYSACYYLAFGVTYTSEMAMELFPENSPVRFGFRDGSLAARESRAQKRQAKASPSAPAEHKVEEDPEKKD